MNTKICQFQNVKCVYPDTETTLEELVATIRNHPMQSAIRELQQCEYGSPEYKKIKKTLPCVTPHGTFLSRKNHPLTLSGLFYYDVDLQHIPSNMSLKEALEHLQDLHHDKAVLIGKSVGGRGLYLYIKANLPYGFAWENFNRVHEYIKTTYLKELSTDQNAAGVKRLHLIPHDPSVIYNPDAVLNLELDEVQKSLTNCIKKQRVCCTSDETFLPIDQVVSQIKNRTIVDVGDADILVEDIWFCNLFIPPVIPDGRKHTVYRAMVQCLMYNNPGIALSYILSFINYINTTRTSGHPMAMSEMKRTVTDEYNRVQETGEIMVGRTKRYHANPRFNKSQKQKIIAQYRGAETKAKSHQIIRDAIQELQSANQTITIKAVVRHLQGRLSTGTVKRYWKAIRNEFSPPSNSRKRRLITTNVAAAINHTDSKNQNYVQ